MSKKKWKNMKGGGNTGAFYGVGALGALVYYMQNASSFGQVILGILKSIIWPAVVVHKAFGLLGL